MHNILILVDLKLTLKNNTSSSEAKLLTSILEKKRFLVCYLLIYKGMANTLRDLHLNLIS